MTTNVAKLDLNQGLEPTPEEVKAEQALLDSLLPVEVDSKLVAKKPRAAKKKPKAKQLENRNNTPTAKPPPSAASPAPMPQPPQPKKKAPSYPAKNNVG